MLPSRPNPAPPGEEGTWISDKNSLFQEKAAMETIHASVDFLLEALAEDLNAPIPSKEPAFLHILNDRVCLVRTLVERLEAARTFLSTTEDYYGSQEEITAPPR